MTRDTCLAGRELVGGTRTFLGAFPVPTTPLELLCRHPKLTPELLRSMFRMLPAEALCQLMGALEIICARKDLTVELLTPAVTAPTAAPPADIAEHTREITEMVIPTLTWLEVPLLDFGLRCWCANFDPVGLALSSNSTKMARDLVEGLVGRTSDADAQQQVARAKALVDQKEARPLWLANLKVGSVVAQTIDGRTCLGAICEGPDGDGVTRIRWLDGSMWSGAVHRWPTTRTAPTYCSGGRTCWWARLSRRLSPGRPRWA